MFEQWEVGAGALLGAAFLVMGVAVRSRQFHAGVQRTYLRRDSPAYYRNAIFAMIPIGIAFLCLIAGAGLQQAHGGIENGAPSEPVAELVLLVGVVCLGVACWWTIRPPDWAKPAWVREYDRARKLGEPVPEYVPPAMSGRAYTLNWLGLGAIAVLWLALSLPLGPLLIGLGLGVSLLLTHRPHSA